MKKGFFRKLFITILIILILLATHKLWMPLPARFLIVRDDIKKADAILVLSGDKEFNREEKAIELYKKGLAPRVVRMLEKEDPDWFDVVKSLLNLEIAQEFVYGEYFARNGLVGDSVILGESVATSTFDEITAARMIFLENNIQSIILVTSDYHMRRSLITAKKLLKPYGVKIYNASVYSDEFNPDRWWTHEGNIRDVIFEYLSIVFYITYHFMLGK